ncbi:SDR family oxidoreductase [Nitrospirillum sp. BR 11163]|uniref:SDR family oxidoreductase n=1 Tax=Nitrospirillum sp. BR 11163 TaxID=3104323 RepID=UPI002AFF94FB|nr:SDR family oxidoreductase [Nitrospirillum sp. BR 11163]MEA1671946.1 SDR family oxidoreductase [Nitrospirillum sp. BR 11163]
MARLAVVTGGTRGIGAEISKTLARAGHVVVAIYARNDDAAQRFNDETGCLIRRWDVSSAEACEEGMGRLSAEIGHCDILVNNAGINSDNSLLRMQPRQWNEVMATNTGGCFNMTKSVFGKMKERRFGRIIHIGSVVGRAGAIGVSNYVASKAAINGLSKAIAMEGAPFGITSNVVEPGYIDAGLIKNVPDKILDRIRQNIPVGRLGTPEEVAHAVMFLADEKAAFITGVNLMVNGGHHLGV